jgi:hypothetical protein
LNKELERYKKSDEYARSNIAGRTSNVEVLEYIFDNETNLGLLRGAIANKHLPESLHRKIFDLKDFYAIRFLLNRNDVTEDDMIYLDSTLSLSDAVVELLLSYEKTPMYILDKYISSSSLHREWASKNRNLDSATTTKLLSYGEISVDLNIIERIDLPVKQFEQFLNLNNPHYDFAMTMNIHTPVHVLEEICKRDYSGVVLSHYGSISAEGDIHNMMGRLPQINETIARAILKYNYAHIISVLLRNPSCPPTILEEFSNSDNYDYRAYVARHPSTSTEVLEKLAADKIGIVRKAVKSNPNYTSDIELTLSPFEQKIQAIGEAESEEELDRFLTDKSLRVRGAAYFRMYEIGEMSLQNTRDIIKEENFQACMSHWLNHRLHTHGIGDKLFLKTAILLDGDSEVAKGIREDLIKDEEDILLILSSHNLPFSIWEITRKFDLTPEMLTLLAECPKQSGWQYVSRDYNIELGVVDYGSYVSRYPQIVAALHANTPESVIEKLWTVNDKYIKAALLTRSDTPQNVLARFAKRKDAWAREAVAKNLNTPKEILEVLALDEDFNVATEAKATLEKLG